MVRPRLAILTLALAAAIAVTPLVVNGSSCGHDFDFHLVNWLEAAQQLRHGNLHPQWAVTPAWNAGEPRLVFYPPLSWTIGALLTLAASAATHLLAISPASALSPQTAFTAVPVLYTALALFAAGLALWYAARPLAGDRAALLAATSYLTNPYTLFTAYERSAFAELLAAALFPLLLALLLPRVTPPTTATPGDPDPHAPPRIIPLSLLVTLLWLSNAPAAVMGCYTLALLALGRLAALLRHPKTRPAALRFTLQTAFATALGLALAGFYLVPAIAERPWVQLRMAVLPGLSPADNTLFHHTADPDHDAVLHTASLIALILLTAALVALAIAVLRDRRRATRASSPNPLAATLATLAAATAVIALLLTPLSAAIWRHLPELAFLQFPWRLLAILAVITALAVALALRNLRLPPALLAGLCLVVALAATLPAYRTFHQACDAPDTPAARFAQFHAPPNDSPGSEPTDEYTPADADNDALTPTNPPFRLLSPTAPDAAPATAGPNAASPHAPAPHTLDLDLAQPMLLVLNLRAYPAWTITRNGAPTHDEIPRDDGLLAIRLPSGHSHIVIQWHPTPSERAGELTSALALLLLALLWRCAHAAPKPARRAPKPSSGAPRPARRST